MTLMSNFASLRPANILCVIALATSCSSSATSPPLESATSPLETEQPAAPPHDAGAQDDAKNTSQLYLEPQAPKPFTPPQEMQQLPVTDVSSLPSGKRCRHVSSTVHDYEQSRLVPALDALMRREGGYVLPAVPRQTATPSLRVGETVRGDAGENLMVVGTYNQCLPTPPLVVSSDGSISAVYITPKPRRKKTVSLCQPHCPGCGMASPDLPLLVEVPEGSFVAPPKHMEVPIDVQLQFTSNQACMPKP